MPCRGLNDSLFRFTNDPNAAKCAAAELHRESAKLFRDQSHDPARHDPCCLLALGRMGRMRLRTWPSRWGDTLTSSRCLVWVTWWLCRLGLSCRGAFWRQSLFRMETNSRTRKVAYKQYCLVWSCLTCKKNVEGQGNKSLSEGIELRDGQSCRMVMGLKNKLAIPHTYEKRCKKCLCAPWGTVPYDMLTITPLST